MSFTVPPAYDRSIWQQILTALERSIAGCFRKGQDVDLARGERLILHSPTGAVWILGVSIDGALTITGQPGQWKFDEARNSGLGLLTGMF